jgi:thiol-disulfide isomerase/thioredoxin
MSADPRRRIDPFTAFLVGACVVLAALVVGLTMQNRSLKEQIGQLQSGLPADHLKSGDVVPPIPVVEDGGGTKTIAFGEGETRTVLLVFSSHCPACKETLPIWEQMLKSPPAPGVRVVGIQTDRLDPNPNGPALVTAAFPFPVYGYKHVSPDPLAKVSAIPAAIVLDAKGVVTDALFGVPDSDTEGKLRQALAG